MSSSAARDPFGLVGTLIEWKYRVDRVVAEGGFGVVYAGWHRLLNVPIAIKLLKPSPGASAEGWQDLIAQFQDEARTLARLRHAYVVAVLDSGVAPLGSPHGGVPWMVLEWLEGETLRDHLLARRGRGGRSRAECMELLRPVLDAIADAHDAGIAHRDIKPSNVMLVPDGHGGVMARVLDFGVAKIVHPDRVASATGDTATDSATSAFTTASAAPEQLSGARTGTWTDVFALGLLITEVLTDRAPLPAEDRNEHYRAVFDPERPTPKRLGVDAGAWEPVLARALAVRPAERPPDARALLVELDAALADSREAEPPAARVVMDDARLSAPPDSGFAATDRRTQRGRGAWLGDPRARRRAMLVGVGAGAIVALAVSLRARHGPAPVARVDASTPACTSNAACSAADGGRPAICRHDLGVCVPLESEDCHVLAEPGDLARDDTVLLGAMFPLTGADAAEFGRNDERAVELARRDFAEAMTGLAGVGERAIAVVSCDDAADPRRAAAHLVDRVGVPAVIGFHSSVEAIELANAVFVPHGVLTIAALNGNPLVTTVPQPSDGPRLVWRTTYSTADAATAMGRFLGDVLEPALRGPGGEKLRVASVRPKNAAGAAFADALFDGLRFNGKPVLENGDAFREISYDADAADGGAGLAAATDELLAFRPHVVVYAAGRPVVSTVFRGLEERWPRGVPRPRYVSAGLVQAAVIELVGRDADRRRRFFGLTPVSETPANARFVLRFNEVYADRITRTRAPNSSYDAFYLLAYATYALDRDARPTGPHLAEAFARLGPPGRAVDVGMAGILDAYASLRRGEKIDLQGATGALDFDRSRGEASFDYSILCVGVDEAGNASEGIPSGLVYVAGTSKLEGALHCP